MAQHGKVVALADRSSNAKYWSVEGMLTDALEEIRNGKRVATKAVILFLDDTDGKYHIGFHQAGMSFSQIVALLEISKADFVEGILHADPC